jgi:hypothetical protein
MRSRLRLVLEQHKSECFGNDLEHDLSMQNAIWFIRSEYSESRRELERRSNSCSNCSNKLLTGYL